MKDSTIDAVAVTASAELSHHAGRIVVGVDGSTASAGALTRAMVLADALDCSVEAITCWNYPAQYGTFYTEGYSPEDDAQVILETAATAAFDGNPPEHFSSRTRQGSPAQVLIEASKGADMLIVGTRGHGGVVGLLMGSVSSSCAEHAHCPVLVLHSD